MKKMRLLALLVVLTMLLCACGKKDDTGDKDKETKPGTTTEAPTEFVGETGGTPTESFKFTDLPDVYTPEQALKDGCLVLQWDEGSETPHVRGIDYWENFLNTSRQNQKVTLRVYYFTEGSFWFSDMYYANGFYSLYTRDAYSENQIGPFQYLTRVQEKDVYSGEDLDFFILTDDAELGSKEVMTLTYICDIEAERNVSFTIVDFTTYFQ